MQTIAVLLTVHNRKEKTLACLDNLHRQLPITGYSVDIYLTDDGCTDGTPEAIRERYPEVNIIKGDGNLFWNRGMYTAWKKAAETKDYDFYLWLNDDTYLYNDAVQTILECSHKTNEKSLICGVTCSKTTGEVTYSAFHKQKKLHPNGTMQECEIICGNFVLVPKLVYKNIGNVDWTFRHAIGDHDYGLRAIKNGIKCYITPKFIGTCENTFSPPLWAQKKTPIIKRFKILYSPLGYSEPIPFFIYEKRHFGLFIAIKHFLSIHLRALFPQLWK